MERYHHGNLHAELLARGMEALEAQGADGISLRSLAEGAGVSKTAPYRHFPDKEAFLTALADEGFHLLYIELEKCREQSYDDAGALGRAYMDFAMAHPAVYRLMTSPVSCKIPQNPVPWARKALLLLGEALVKHQAKADVSSPAGWNTDAVAAAWGYIHGIVLVRIDGIFPTDLPEPDWNRLASTIPALAPIPLGQG
jgi:AcrR family transcriptional regulator